MSNSVFNLIVSDLNSSPLTYIRHHLAPISGIISRHDSDAVTAAWRELFEETTLTPSSVELWRKGIPFTFSDPSVGREWTVHPFAFRLKDPSEGGQGEHGIKIDWEHDEWQWHDPDSVVDDQGFGGVPRLRESLRRVWFEGQMSPGAAKALAIGLDRLRNDHESGARELTALALGIFRDVVIQMKDGLDQKWWETIRMAAWHLWKNGRESMGAGILNALLVVLAEMEKLTALDLIADTKRERMLAMLDHHLNIRKSMATRIKNSLVDYIQSQFLGKSQKKETFTILTLSASSTIRDSIVDAYAALDIRTLDLRILESRPLFEGVSIASTLYTNFKSRFESSDKNLKISIYTDASAALASAGVDILILGADRISSTRGVSNKAGSLTAVLSLKHVSPKAKVLIISETEKVKEPCVGGNDAEDNDPTEVASTWRNEGVKGYQFIEETTSSNRKTTQENISIEVKNIYFEWVPLSLVDGFVCEEGILGKDGIAQRSEQIEKEIERFFGGL